MAPASAADGPGERDVVGMCYVVVVRETGSTAEDVRVRFELRSDLSSDRRESRSVLGVADACEVLGTWLRGLLQPHR